MHISNSSVNITLHPVTHSGFGCLQCLQKQSGSADMALQKPRNGGPLVISSKPFKDIVVDYKESSDAFRAGSVFFGGVGVALLGFKVVMFGWRKWTEKRIRCALLGSTHKPCLRQHTEHFRTFGLLVCTSGMAEHDRLYCKAHLDVLVSCLLNNSSPVIDIMAWPHSSNHSVRNRVCHDVQQTLCLKVG